ncbi:MAG: ATP-binding cassette domain-containing protein [Defluviitaleaceae bacterium]|nr:ATP-binding cassette domain-containing protein [Defluviitaleaceae bacterium]MCL2837395.1 ATP-binding cassette domain-containing protein [Defluviitaleaceae bacterium]
MIIQVDNLSKAYGNVKAVKGISFAVREGSLFSFLGTNGAGKSTTINILTTLLAKTSGKAAVGGFDVVKDAQKVRNLIGVVFQDNVLDPILTVRENLTVRGSLYGLSGVKLKNAVENAVKIAGVSEFATRPYGKLSGGQRRRTDIARALVHTPRLLFLDEPTTGLDPKTRRDMWLMIRDLQKNSGMTVFLTTHYMEEAAESDDIVVIHKGEVKAHGTPLELKMEYCSDLLKMTLDNGDYIERKLEKTTDALSIIDGYRNRIANVEIINGTLDDVFLNLTEGLEHVD